MPILRVAVLLTSFNRRELTLKTLASLFSQHDVSHLEVSVFLVDDGCTDGTGDAVRSHFPAVRLLHGDGNLYWNGGMRLAFESALNEGYDAYILLNDDTVLFEDALQRLIAIATEYERAGRPAIVVGSTKAPNSERLTYGGFVLRRRWISIWFEHLSADQTFPQKCDSMNGNFVLIPAQIAHAVGNIERSFRHQFGDLDYGLRARKAGFDIFLIPGFIGECDDHASSPAWADPSIPLKDRWRMLNSPKGVPFKEWLLFTSRHFGWRFPFYAVSPYLKSAALSLSSRF